jgi:hypothetical protein
MEFKEAIDWIRRFGRIPTDCFWITQGDCNWVVENLCSCDVISTIVEWYDAVDDWSRDKTKEQVEALVFRVLDSYLLQYLRYDSIDKMQEYIAYIGACYFDYIKSEQIGKDIEEDTIYEAVESVLYNIIDGLRSICEAWNITIEDIAERTSCGFSIEYFRTYDLDYCDIQFTEQPGTIGTLPLEAYITNNKGRVLKAIDAEMASCVNKQGRRIALIICALEQHGYIANINGNIERIYKAFKQRYPNKVGTRQSVSQYINVSRNNQAKSDKSPFTDEELKRFIRTI